MGNEMGNHNTSALKEKDNTSEAEKQTPQEDLYVDSVKEENQIISTTKRTDADTSELVNKTWEDDTQAEGVKGEYPKILTTEAKYVVEKAAEASADATIEPGKDADDVNKETQTTPMAEAEVQEKSTGLASEYTRRTHAGDMNVENQMCPKAELENVLEKNRVLASESTSVLEKDSLEGDSQAGDVNVKNQMHPTAEAKDVHEKDHLKHPTAEGREVHGEAAMLALDDTKSAFQEDEFYEDTHFNGKLGENAVIPVAESEDIQGKATTLAYVDALNVIHSFGSTMQEITEVRQTENSPNAVSVEAGGEGCGMPISLSEGTEEYDKKKVLDLKKSLLVSYDNHLLDSKSSSKQEELETMDLTLDSVGMSNDAKLQELSDTHCNHNELVKVQSEPSLQESKSLHRSDFLDNDPHCPQDKDDILEKEMENQENMFCADKSDGVDGDELRSVMKDTTGIKFKSLSVGKRSNGNLLAKVNYITDDFLNSLLESAMDNPLRSDHEENCMVPTEEGKRSRSGSKMEDSHNYSSGQFSEESKEEFKAEMVIMHETIGTNGHYNGETYKVLASSDRGVSNDDQVADLKVTENGYQIDTCVNNYHKASDKLSTVSEQKDFVVPEAEVDVLIAMSGVVDCRHEEGEYNKNKIVDEIDKISEASYAKVERFEGKETSEQRNSHLVTTDQADSLTLKTSASLLPIYSCLQGNVNHSKTSTATATSLLASDLKHAADNKLFSIIADKLDSSNLTMPALAFVDEAFEEGEYYSQHIGATSSKEAEITSSAATLSSQPYPNNFMFTNGVYEAMDRVTRLSTESNLDAPSMYSQIQKSPSFNLTLQVEERPEKSDQIPLLYLVKTEIGSLSNQTRLDLINSTHDAEYGQCILQHEEMPVEDKVVTVERSYSVKSKTPFFGLLEEEEAHLLVTPQKHDLDATGKAVKEIESTSPKGSEKRKPRSSFFSSCMCCATVMN